MGIGVSVFMLAVGAVLAFAVNATVPNANLDLIGVILMIAGGIGLLVSLAFASSHRDETYVEERVIDRNHTHPARG
jgi:uncharacterized protein DUF6458